MSVESGSVFNTVTVSTNTDPDFTLTSTGTINTAATFSDAILVSGSIDGTIDIAGFVNASNIGVDFSGHGTLTNTGTIDSVYNGVAFRSATGGVVVNSGIIDSTGSGNFGVASQGPVNVTNLAGGTIIGSGDGILTYTYTGGAYHLGAGAGGTVYNAGLIEGTASNSSAILIGSGTVENAGTLVGGSSGTAITFGATTDTVLLDNGSSLSGNIVGAGASANNTIVLSGNAIGNTNLANVIDFGTTEFTGGGIHEVNTSLGASPTILIDDATTVAFHGSVPTGATTITLSGSSGFGLVDNTADSGLTINFGGASSSAANLFALDDSNFAGTITNFGANDEINLVAGPAYAAGETFTYSNGIGTLLSSTGSVVSTINNFNVAANEPASGSFAVVRDGIFGTPEVVGCFYAGVKLATPSGEIAVESLRAGDLVLTAGGTAHPIIWLGESKVSTRFADPIRMLPIRVTAGALGDGMPVRDLLLSPCHALMLDGILVQAGALVNGVTIHRETNVPEVFTYYHVELSHHALLIADGVPAETFVDNIDRMNFSNWADRTGPTAPMPEMDLPRAKAARQIPQATRQRLGLEIRKTA